MSDPVTSQQEAPPAPVLERDGPAIDAAISSKASEEAWLEKFDAPEAPDLVQPPLEVAPVERAEVKEQPADDTPQESAPDAGGDEKGRAAYETALAALRRDGIPKSVLEKLAPEEVIQFGSHRAKNQADVDGIVADLKSLKAKPAEKAKTEAPPTQSPASVDLAAKAKAVAEKFGLDESDVPALEEFGKSILEAAGQEVSALRQQNETNSQSILRMEVERAREKLSGRFPGLQDDAKFLEVLGKADRIDDSLPILERLSDAAASVFYDEIKQASSKAKAEGVRQKLDGQPTTSSRPAPTRTLSQDEKENYALEQLEKGTSWRSVQKSLTG